MLAARGLWSKGERNRIWAHPEHRLGSEMGPGREERKNVPLTQVPRNLSWSKGLSKVNHGGGQE